MLSFGIAFNYFKLPIMLQAASWSPAQAVVSRCSSVVLVVMVLAGHHFSSEQYIFLTLQVWMGLYACDEAAGEEWLTGVLQGIQDFWYSSGFEVVQPAQHACQPPQQVIVPVLQQLLGLLVRGVLCSSCAP
jgi:hypothetical protein